MVLRIAMVVVGPTAHGSGTSAVRLALPTLQQVPLAMNVLKRTGGATALLWSVGNTVTTDTGQMVPSTGKNAANHALKSAHLDGFELIDKNNGGK